MTQDHARGAHENRTAREKFTKALIRICMRLDNQATFEIENNNKIVRSLIRAGRLPPEEARESLEIIALWVVGSYARGALTCGDLDVVVQTRRTDGRPSRIEYTRLIKPAFGHVPHLRVYEGTPEKTVQESVSLIRFWSGRPV